MVRGTADPSASLGMTKGRGALPSDVMGVVTASQSSFISRDLQIRGPFLGMFSTEATRIS
jgi:hypothetical protein